MLLVSPAGISEAEGRRLYLAGRVTIFGTCSQTKRKQPRTRKAGKIIELSPTSTASFEKISSFLHFPLPAHPPVFFLTFISHLHHIAHLPNITALELQSFQRRHILLSHILFPSLLTFDAHLTFLNLRDFHPSSPDLSFEDLTLQHLPEQTLSRHHGPHIEGKCDCHCEQSTFQKEAHTT